jgi:hypothetical protein
VIAAIASQPVLPWLQRLRELLVPRLPIPLRVTFLGGWAAASSVGVLGLFVWSLTHVAAQGFNPFIYFRF